MLVSRIQEFLIQFSNKKTQLSLKDSALIEQMVLRFSNLTPDLCLKEEDFNQLLAWYAERWSDVLDGHLDYTFNPSGINELWIELAQDLGKSIKKSYLEILIPQPNSNLSKITLHAPNGIFLGDDDNTWHSVTAIITHWKLTGILTTQNAPKDISRLLSIKELYRLHSKKGDGLSFNLGNKFYDGFWDYLLKEIAPSWKKPEDFPPQLLMALLDVLNTSNRKNPKQFRLALVNLQAEINNCNLSQASSFYGVKLAYQDKPVYLFEILVACWRNEAEIEAKLAPVAQWLTTKNPAFVSKNPAFSKCYESIQAGPYFTVSQLTEILSQLDPKPYPHVAIALQQLKEKLKGKTTIDAEVVEQLVTLYRLRWNSIIDTTNDYFRLPSDVNKAWIFLAQKLAGAGLTSGNYYQLLIPTLIQDIDPITATPVTAYPLTSFILSDDGTQLILLSNCENHHKAHGTFFNCNAQSPVPLTYKEVKRLEPNTEYYSYYLSAEGGKPDPAIRKETVEALIKLINGALYPEGLMYGKDYTETQTDNAVRAYGDFNDYVSKLPEDERNRLYQQHILWHGRRYTVAEILTEIQKGQTDSERECVAVFTKYLAKLVCDYNPNAVFAREFSELSHMRSNSDRKVYREYDDITEEEATRRLLTIAVSLMTHQFNYGLRGNDLFLWDCSNSVTNSGEEIFIALKETFKGKADRMRFVYASLMEDIIMPSLAKKTKIFTSMVRYNDTNEWLKSISDGTLFKTNLTCFDPQVLITVLADIVPQKVELRKIIDNFIEEALHTLTQDKNKHQIWIRINIKFVEILPKLGSQKEEILQKLRSANLDITSSFYEKIVDFLLRKSVYRKFKSQQGTFFMPDVDSGVQELKSKLVPINFTELNDLSFSCALRKISQLFNSSPETRMHRQFFDEYIEKGLATKIPEKGESTFSLYSSALYA